MIIDQNEKLVNLARDIVESGINPSDLTIVTPDHADSDNYIVLEGNRRVAAIKLLVDPKLTDIEKKSPITKSIKELSQNLQKSQFEMLRCVVFDRRDATHWIELKHTGENKGVGIVGWDSESVARFRHGLGKPSMALQVVEFVKKNVSLDDATKQNLAKCLLQILPGS